MRMVVIDTGLDECFNRDRIVNEMTIDSSLKVIGRENDKIGHGTAVVSTIVKNSVTSEIIILKVYDDQLTIYPERLTKALSYCESSLDFDLILISSGTPIYSADLHDVVKK